MSLAAYFRIVMSPKKAGPSRRVTRASNKQGPLDSDTEFELIQNPAATDTTVENRTDVTVTVTTVRPPHTPTRDPPEIASSSSSDSDSDFCDAYIHPTANPMTSTTNSHATSVYANLSHPPILSEGELTPKALMTFEEDCNSYFLNAKGGVTPEQKVLRILNSFRDTHVRNWITTDRAALIELSFEDFMLCLRAEFLPPNWEDKVRSRILGSKMSRNDRFIHWARSLQAEKYVLRGTTSHLPDDRLRDTMEANVDFDLRLLVMDIAPAVRGSLTDWMNAVEKLDAKRKQELKRHRELLSDELHHAKRQNIRTSSSHTSQNTNPAATQSR